MCRVLQGKRANLYIDMLSMTMKLGQGDMVSVCGFVGRACDCHVTHVTWYGSNNEAPSRKNVTNRTLLFFLVKKSTYSQQRPQDRATFEPGLNP